MPRALTLHTPSTASQVVQRSKPRLWNAKNRINSNKGAPKYEIELLKKDPYSTRWRSFASPDVVEFIDKLEGRDSTGHPINEMHPDEKLKLLRNPTLYFSRPHNVPEFLRKQILFPNFTVTLTRSPHLGPYFAQFNVPLSFGKLDLKSYLKNLYNVDVVHVRSFVVYSKTNREQPARPYSRGTLKATAFKKKMTVQLADPFEWPAEPSEEFLEKQHEKSRYWDSMTAYAESSRKEATPAPVKEDKIHRKSIAEQARALLEGREKWRPTWTQITSDARAMEGRYHHSSPTQPDTLSLPDRTKDSPPSVAR